MLDDDWHRVCPVDDLDEEDVVQHLIGDVALAVYNVGGEFYATADTCSHQGASLSDGYVAGDLIECPLHQAQFHIPTGKAMSPPADEDLATYPVKVENGDIFVQL